RCRIEHDDIRRHARRDTAAIREMNSRRRKRSHLVDRLLQRERLPLANVARQHAWERAESARMRMTLMCRTIYRECAAVAADHRVPMRENAIEIVLAHRETNHAHAAPIALEQRDGHVVRR